eukprot:3558435-Prymnesium_polylepis.1
MAARRGAAPARLQPRTVGSPKGRRPRTRLGSPRLGSPRSGCGSGIACTPWVGFCRPPGWVC